METVAVNVQIEEVGPCKKLLTIEVPKENIDVEWEKRFAEVCRMAELPGFRKGRAPKKLVERRFAEQIKEDVKQAVVSETYQKALDENQIDPIGTPEFSDIDFDPEKPLNYKVTLEVKPEFDIENYQGIALTRKSATVTDEEVGKTLGAIASQKIQINVIEDGKIEQRDQVICDCQVKVGKKVVWKDTDIEIFAANPFITGIEAPELAGAMNGVSSGKQCNTKVKLSDSFPVEEHRGKDATLVLTINEIKRPVVPEIDDAFAKQLDFDSLDELKDNMRDRLGREKQTWVQQNLTSQLYAKLIEMADFDLPEGLIAHQSEKKLRQYQIELLQKGTPVDRIREETDKLRDASKESVVHDIKMSFILEQIADKEKLYATETDIENRIAEMASAYRTTPAKLRSQLEKEDYISNLRYTIREEKVVDLLMKKAVIEEESPGGK